MIRSGSVFKRAGYKIEPIWTKGEYVYPNGQHNYYLIDGRILLLRYTGDVAVDDQWYGFNDAKTASL